MYAIRSYYEFKDTFEDSNENGVTNTEYVSDCQIDTDEELRLPDSYISNISERMHLYRNNFV